MIQILKYGEVANEDIFARAVPTVNVEDIVSEIIATVRRDGDRALYAYCEKFDGAKLDSLAVSAEEIDEAFALVEPAFIEILEKAAKNIRAFHEKQVRNSFIINNESGIVVGQKVIPVDRAGLYYIVANDLCYHLSMIRHIDKCGLYHIHKPNKHHLLMCEFLYLSFHHNHHKLANAHYYF